MKILIIGANGFTGRQILTDLSASSKYQVYGCSLHNDIAPSSKHHFFKLDILNKEAVNEAFSRVKPDIVINTSALSVPDYCENHHQEAMAINSLAVAHIASLANRWNSRLIHLSTDFVFDGKSDRLYTETDKTNPINFYGITKREGEIQVENICNNYAIIRVVVIYGKSMPGQHGNILQLIANKLGKGETVKVVSDQWRTPTYVGDISKAIEQLMYLKHNEIYHICGSDCLTIAEIAYKVAHILRLDHKLIIPVTTEEMKESTPRPRFSGLSIERAKKEINYTPLTLEEGIIKTFFE